MSSRRYPPPPVGVLTSQQRGPSAAVAAASLPLSPAWPGRLPSLHLYPTSVDSIGPRTIYLPPDGNRIKIGRGTSAKTSPEQGNAYFDTKVFSRAHADVWQSNGGMFIRDTKSSNGTFVNGERLSAEGVESDPYQLQSGDQVQFGIDISSDDQTKIAHHKVVTKVYCVFGQEDVELSQRELRVYNQNRRLAKGPSVNDLTRQLQLELQKSREAAADLQVLQTAMNEVQETLGGGMNPIFTSEVHPNYPSKAKASPEELHSLQHRVSETQHALGENASRLQLTELRLSDQDALRSELEELRTRLDGLQQRQDEEDDPGDDDDDSSSVSTVGRRAGRRGDEEDVVELFEDADDELLLEEEGRSRPEGRAGRTDAFFGRPSTPEPTSQHRTSSSDEDDEDNHNPVKYSPSPSSPRSTTPREEELSLLETLRRQLETLSDNSQLVLVQNETFALRLESLEVEHSGVLSSIGTAVGRIVELEEKEKKWEVTREGWAKERELLDVERENMKEIIREWEEAKRRDEEEREERRLNEGREESVRVEKEGRSSSSPSSPPLGDQQLDSITITIRPSRQLLESTPSDRTPSPSRSPSRPKRAPVPSIFKPRPTAVRRISSSGTLRPAGFLGLARDGEIVLRGRGEEVDQDMATIRQVSRGGTRRRVEPVESALPHIFFIAGASVVFGLLFLSYDAAHQVSKLFT
ncbi:hypothetical protein BDY24DRAFT_280521 [Mrakia frigida]|uniref:uncharacterized protein n=1 Tax=Mrakia frigida TaxID=29902 RepID=UPI003FCC0541